jgi:hypothetical protein
MSGIGHIILGCHRCIVEEKVPDENNLGHQKESIAAHVFTIDARRLWKSVLPGPVGAESESAPNSRQPEVLHVRSTLSGRAGLVIALCCCVCLLVLGTTLLTFHFKFLGLTGKLLKDKAEVFYSFSSVGEAVPFAAGKPKDVAVRWMEASYFAFGLGMPFGMLCTLACLWFLPLSLRHQRLLLVIAEVFNAWSALDVFVGSLVGALLEIQQVPIIYRVFKL